MSSFSQGDKVMRGREGKRGELRNSGRWGKLGKEKKGAKSQQYHKTQKVLLILVPSRPRELRRVHSESDRNIPRSIV